MLIPLDTITEGLFEMIGQKRIDRDAGKALIGELVSKVYDHRINMAIERLEAKRDAEMMKAKNSI